MNTQEIEKMAKSAKEQTGQILVELKQLPNYGKTCSCAEKTTRYTIANNGEGNTQEVCLKCGGNTSGKGAMNNCPKCGTNSISAGDWQGQGDEAFCEVVCHECGLTWNESFSNAEWSLP